MDEPLAWPALTNARDLGGRAAAGGQTRPRAVVRADNLTRLTAQGRANLVAYGVRLVLDLRDPRELRNSPIGSHLTLSPASPSAASPSSARRTGKR